MFYQGFPYPQSYIGNEVDDPIWQTVGCTPGYSSCRFADVAVIEYADGKAVADSGWIAVTEKRDSATVTWRSKALDSRKITVDYGPDQPFEGETIDRVGQVTGWQHGTVVNSCAVVAVPTIAGASYECQTVVEGGRPSDGDSGGPAFGRGVSGGVMFAGIVWGQTDTGFLLSALVNMRTDLGDLAVFF
jgi:hypothetical protein